MSFNDNDYWDKKWKLFSVYYVFKVPRKKMKIKILFVLFLSIVSAQTLSVDEAVRIALENKSAISNAEKDVRIAQLSRNSSAALLLPSISASNSFRESTYGNSIIAGSELYSGGVNLSQSLFNFGGKVNSVRQSDNSYQITKIQKRETTSRIILNVYTFYYQHLKDSELYEIAKKDLKLSKRQLDLVKQRFDLGAVSKTDYLKATVRYGSAKSTLLTRELSFNNSFKNLRNSMGLIGTDTNIILPKKVEINLIIPSFDEAYQLMLTNSPSLNILDRRVTSAKIGVKQSLSLIHI